MDQPVPQIAQPTPTTRCQCKHHTILKHSRMALHIQLAKTKPHSSPICPHHSSKFLSPHTLTPTPVTLTLPSALPTTTVPNPPSNLPNLPLALPSTSMPTPGPSMTTPWRTPSKRLAPSEPPTYGPNSVVTPPKGPHQCFQMP